MDLSTSEFEPVRPVRVHEQVATQLRELILSGQYGTGERLPHERELIDQFRVSRTAVRQAMQRLEHQGLVDVRAGSGGGCFVAQTRLDSVRESFANLFALRGLDVDDFLAAKSELEPAIFGAAVRAITAAQLEELDENLDACRKAVEDGDDNRVFVLSHNFHRIVGHATANSLLQLVLAALVDVAGHIPNFRGRPPGGWDGVLQDHHQILEALRAGNEEQVRAVAHRHGNSVRAAFRQRKSDQRKKQ